MSLHYLDPSDKPRECDCSEGAIIIRGNGPYRGWPVTCYKCQGTGRLGVEGKKPDVSVFEHTEYSAPQTLNRESLGAGFYAFVREGAGWFVGPKASADDALAAARAACKEET